MPRCSYAGTSRSATRDSKDAFSALLGPDAYLEQRGLLLRGQCHAMLDHHTRESVQVVSWVGRSAFPADGTTLRYSKTTDSSTTNTRLTRPGAGGR
jgi:hypothetical protein